MLISLVPTHTQDSLEKVLICTTKVILQDAWLRVPYLYFHPFNQQKEEEKELEINISK